MIVKYSKKFETGPYMNEDIGFESEIDYNDTDAILEELDRLKNIAIKFHKDNNPQLTDDAPQGYEPLKVTNGYQPIPSVDYRAKEKLEIDIDNATTKADLEFYVEAAEKYGLMELWNEKNKSLNS